MIPRGRLCLIVSNGGMCLFLLCAMLVRFVKSWLMPYSVNVALPGINMVNVGGFTEGNKPDEAVQALVEGVKGDVEKVRVLKISHAVTRLLSGVSGPTLT